jgi:hypothetical protein
LHCTKLKQFAGSLIRSQDKQRDDLSDVPFGETEIFSLFYNVNVLLKQCNLQNKLEQLKLVAILTTTASS